MSDQATNLYQRINAIKKAVPAIPKRGEYKDSKTGKKLYNFRRAEDINAAVDPLVVEHGLVVTPIGVVDKEVETIGKMTRVIITIEYLIITDDGQGQLKIGITAEGADTSDKAVQKAYTYALKTLYTQLFGITDVDPDDERPDIAGAREYEAAGSLIDQAHQFADTIDAATGDDRATHLKQFRGWGKANLRRMDDVTPVEISPWWTTDGKITLTVRDYLEKLVRHLA